MRRSRPKLSYAGPVPLWRREKDGKPPLQCEEESFKITPWAPSGIFKWEFPGPDPEFDLGTTIEQCHAPGPEVNGVFPSFRSGCTVPCSIEI